VVSVTHLLHPLQPTPSLAGIWQIVSEDLFWVVHNVLLFFFLVGFLTCLANIPYFQIRFPFVFPFISLLERGYIWDKL